MPETGRPVGGFVTHHSSFIIHHSKGFPVPRTAVGRAAADLPWLCPNTSGLVGLAERPAALPTLAAADPALLTFLARFALDPASNPGSFPPHRLLSAALPDVAARFLAYTPVGWLDPLAAVVIDLEAVSARAGTLARVVATATGRADPEAAGLAARLSPLGWYAVAATNLPAAISCLRDPDFPTDPVQCQRDHWGYDQHAIARRLAARWRFPGWLAAVVGGLDLPDTARAAGPFPDLTAVVALAVTQAQRDTIQLGLTPKADTGRLRDQLRFAGTFPPDAGPVAPEPVGLPADPHRVPLVGSLLRTAAEARRRSGAALALRLEQDVDDLHAQLARVSEVAGEELRGAKLAALAEFAAGAGHEINNPLAVISGHAQRLLRTERDDDRVESLRSVVRQTQRIAGILKELMQFARPARPESGRVVVADLFTAVRTDLEPAAAERGVRVEQVSVPADVTLDADPRQLRSAVGAVVRNGVEAAGADGWVRLTCETTATAVRLVVEDGGPGMTAEAVEHAFDPFFCGRSAGRGRGLGLPTAWQLTRQNSGDLRHEPADDGPTRFVFTFPQPAANPFSERRAA
jgi:signal transduction histidine kinase